MIVAGNLCAFRHQYNQIQEQRHLVLLECTDILDFYNEEYKGQISVHVIYIFIIIINIIRNEREREREREREGALAYAT